MTKIRHAITIRQCTVMIGASALLLIGADQATKRWAAVGLSPGRVVPLVQAWLSFKRTIAVPWTFVGSPLVPYILMGLMMLGLLALVAAGGVGRPIHAIATGLVLGGLGSSLFDFVRNGQVENFIGIGSRPDTMYTFNLAVVAIALGGGVLAIGGLTGSFPSLWQRNRRNLRSR